MKNLVTRSISGAVYVALMVSAVLFGGPMLAVVLCLLATVAIYELTAMTCLVKYPRLSSSLDIAAACVLILTLFFSFSSSTGGAIAGVLFLIYFCLIIVRFISQLYAHHANPVFSLSRSMLAQIYIAIPLALVPVIRAITSPEVLLAVLIFIWVNDTGAFCVGSLIGRHKLFERISPKKTWEGFFGGLAFCVIAALVMFYAFPDYFAIKNATSCWTICRLGIVVAVFATFGDLIESLIKRSSNVKDSGNIIPGHGGILDRIDSLLMVIPVTLVFFILYFT